jgi:hypothetical protein
MALERPALDKSIRASTLMTTPDQSRPSAPTQGVSAPAGIVRFESLSASQPSLALRASFG